MPKKERISITKLLVRTSSHCVSSMDVLTAQVVVSYRERGTEEEWCTLWTIEPTVDIMCIVVHWGADTILFPVAVGLKRNRTTGSVQKPEEHPIRARGSSWYVRSDVLEPQTGKKGLPVDFGLHNGQRPFKWTQTWNCKRMEIVGWSERYISSNKKRGFCTF